MQEKWLKIDPHTHTKGVSRCSPWEIERHIDWKIQMGYDGMVLTNHCQRGYYPPEEHQNYVDRVLEEYEKGRRYAEEKGFRLWLGLEVSIWKPHYVDILLYGVTEEFLRAVQNPYELSQQQLFNACKEYGVFMVQAHPYRELPPNFEGGFIAQDLLDENFLHGAELNCSVRDLPRHDALIKEFSAKGLIVTCGVDDHGGNTFFGGMLIPDTVTSGVEFARYLFNAKSTKIFREEKIDEFPCPKTTAKKGATLGN